MYNHTWMKREDISSCRSWWRLSTLYPSLSCSRQVWRRKSRSVV